MALMNARFVFMGTAALLALALASSCESTDKADGSLNPGQEGEGEPSEGEGEPPSEGEGEGEGEPPSEGEGEGAAEGEGEGPDQPPREVTIICGSIPDRVVQPDRLLITATVVLPEDICAAHLTPLRNPHDDRLIRFVALETTNAPPCDPQQRVANIEHPFRVNRPEDVGEWTMEMIGLGPTIFRKTVHVDSAGAAEAEVGETCAGGRTGFVGDCGEEILCQEPSSGQPDPQGFICSDDEGLCNQAAGPGEVTGGFDVRLEEVEKGCRLATLAQEGQQGEIPAGDCLQEQPDLSPEELLALSPEVRPGEALVIEPAHLTLEQDPQEEGNPALARVSFSGDSFLARWSGAHAVPGVVVGNTFMGEEAVVSTGQGDCFYKYYLQLPALTRYGDRIIKGRLGIINLEANCGRGCLACELAGKLVPDE